MIKTVLVQKCDIRDERGNFICAQTVWNVGKPSPREVEAWGLKQALLWLYEYGLLQSVN